MEEIIKLCEKIKEQAEENNKKIQEILDNLEKGE